MPSASSIKEQKFSGQPPLSHERPSLSFLHWVLWGLGISFVIYQFILRVSLGVMAHDLMTHFRIDATAFSSLGSLFYLGYAGMQIPVGILLDRFGPARISPVCLFLCVVGFTCFVFSENWTIVLIGRFLTGIGSAGAFIGVLKTAQLVFPKRLFGFFVGLTASLGLCGAIFGGGPIGILLEAYTLMPVLEGLVVVGFALFLILTFIFITPKAKDILSSKEGSHKNNHAVFDGLRVILTNPVLIGLLFCTGLMTMGLYSFADAWGASFLQAYQGMNEEMASFSISLIYIGMTVGSTVLGIIADRLNATKKIVSTCGAISALILLLFLLVPVLPFSLVLGLMLVFGVCSSLQVLVFSYILQLLPSRFGGIASGSTNMTIMLLGSLSIYIAGALMDFGWQGTMQEGLKVYGNGSYALAFGAIISLIAIGTLGFIVLSFQAKRVSHRLVHLEESFSVTS